MRPSVPQTGPGASLGRSKSEAWATTAVEKSAIFRAGPRGGAISPFSGVFMYRVGYPGWKVFARHGFPVKVVVQIARDDEAGVFLASSPDLRGPHVEGETLDELHREVRSALSALMQLQLDNHVSE